MLVATGNIQTLLEKRADAFEEYPNVVVNRPKTGAFGTDNVTTTTITPKEDEPLLYAYCEKELKEILIKLEHIHIRNFLIFTLREILLWIEKRRVISKPRFYIWKDYEIPNWERIIIEVATHYKDLDEEDRLWAELEQAIDCAVEEYGNFIENNKKAEELRKMVSACIEELQDD